MSGRLFLKLYKADISKMSALINTGYTVWE